MAELDLAWAAGFLDGDGCITLSTAQYGQPSLSASQCSRLPLEVLVGLFGGTITRHDDNRKPTYRPAYRWRLVSSKAVIACEQLLPYLRLKRRQAEIVLAWAATRTPQEKKSHRPLSETVRRIRNALLVELSQLNKKGVPRAKEIRL